MITLPEHVLQADVGAVGFSWDGTSPHPVKEGVQVPNKETAMDWAEHQRIVCNAGKLLVSWTKEKHQGKGKDAFTALKDAYDASNKGRSVLRVSKGIHQPETNPHLQVRVVASFYNAQSGTTTETHYTLHLNVSATEVTGVDGLVDTFQWEGVQFTYEDANWTYRWPVLPQPPQAKRSTPSRRASISYAQLADHINELARLEKERLQREEQAKAKLLSATLEGKIKLELARLEKEEGLILRTSKKGDAGPKFYKGQTSSFVATKYGKGHNVIWDPKTEKLIKA